jgi:hypothetical protein
MTRFFFLVFVIFLFFLCYTNRTILYSIDTHNPLPKITITNTLRQPFFYPPTFSCHLRSSHFYLFKNSVLRDGTQTTSLRFARYFVILVGHPILSCYFGLLLGCGLLFPVYTPHLSCRDRRRMYTSSSSAPPPRPPRSGFHHVHFDHTSPITRIIHHSSTTSTRTRTRTVTIATKNQNDYLNMQKKK